MNEAGTVGAAMLRHPTVHAADLTVGEAQAVFAARAKTHLLVLVEDGVLVSTVTRDDVADLTDPTAPARDAGRLAGRVVAADDPLLPLREAMADSGLRRAAVVDDVAADRMHLLGLLCLKRSRTDFCTDEGVAAMRAERTATTPPRPV
ncbi:MAG: hypothetical protein ACXVWW_11475 [Nocardioides sp.]